MRLPAKRILFPLLTVLAGGAGFFLRRWLFSLADAQGLLPSFHISSVLALAVAVLMLLLLFLMLPNFHHTRHYSKLFPSSPVSAAGCLVGAAGILYESIRSIGDIGNILSLIVMIGGIVAAICMLVIGYFRQCGGKPPFVLHCVVTVYLMLRTISVCRAWCSEPQLSVFFYPFLASVGLLFYCFTCAEADAGFLHCRRLFFTSQAALLFCLFSVQGSGAVFFLAMSVWLAANAAVPPREMRQIDADTSEA